MFRFTDVHTRNVCLTFFLLNFSNGIIHLPFLDLSFIIFRDIKIKTWLWSANSIESGQTSRMCRMTWFYIVLHWWQRLITFGSIMLRGKSDINYSCYSTLNKKQTQCAFTLTKILCSDLIGRIFFRILKHF